MKNLIWKFIFPMTMFTFILCTKVWFVRVEGDFDEKLTGFPLPYVGRGWHTSLSLQLFIFELLIDFLTYVLFWTCVALLIKRVWKNFKMPKFASILFVTFTILWSIALLIILANPNNLFKLHRDFEIEIIHTHFQFLL